MVELKAMLFFVFFYACAWAIDYFNGELFQWYQVLVCAIICAFCAIGCATSWYPGDNDKQQDWMNGKRH